MSARVIGFARAGAGVLVLAILGYAYLLRIAAGDGNPFDYFGYFTNQTSTLAAAALVATGALLIAERPVPRWLTTARGIATAYLVIVAVVYNTLVPGTGSAPPWVSFVLHALFPALVVIDWAVVGDRPALPWRGLWMLLPYPIAWLGVVLVRGVTDGWVPYGFLLPERGAGSLALHVFGLLAAILAAGAVVWAASRWRAKVLPVSRRRRR